MARQAKKKSQQTTTPRSANRKVQEDGVAAVELPAILDTNAVVELVEALKVKIQSADRLTIKGSKVERVGTAGLQTLAALSLEAGKHDIPLSINGVSDVLRHAFVEAGLENVLTQWEKSR